MSPTTISLPSPPGSPQTQSALVAIVIGSRSDLETVTPARELLTELGIPHEARVLSAHRTPDALFAYVEGAQASGVEVFIAGAGGAAHLPGVIASKTTLPVLGVPIDSSSLQGLDALLAIVLNGGIVTMEAATVTDALERFAFFNVDFSDAWLAARGARLRYPVASFDRDLDKFKDIRRYEPTA